VDQLLALATVLPLLVAAAISALNMLLHGKRRVLDAVAIVTAAVVAAVLAVIMARTAHGDEVYWFAGFRPSHGIAIGIDFAAGPLSAGLACLAAVLVVAAMIFSWRYFERVATYYHVLMLTFMAGMVGFCLTGDIFDLFVWFELMGVSAYALTAYRPEERGSIQGALNFAITNSVGAYLSLSGIAIIYGRTGALNMAQIGAGIARHRPDRLVVVAFVLIITGFLIKGAIVPFHFWLADAHAVAPTPVCVLLSGVMVELGLYAIARVYWSMFGDALGHRAVITGTFLALGLLTAVAGALFCFRERHLKRLLAFSTISHAGMFLTGIALLTPLGLAGAAVYVAGHALVKASLFLCVGIVLHRLGSVNETWLHGRGRRLRVTGVVFTLASFGLADMPPFATFLGKGWIEASGSSHGRAWISRAASGRWCLLRPGRSAQRGSPDGRGGLGGNQRDRSGQAANPCFDDPSSRCSGRGRHRCRLGASCRLSRPGGSRAVPGPDRLQRHRPVSRARRSSRGSVPSRAHRDYHRGPGQWPGLGRRGTHPRLPRPLLEAPAAAAPWFRAGHRSGPAHPALPKWCRQ
jgi:multicomponent Na+:H+ antiporter subunit D